MSPPLHLEVARARARDLERLGAHGGEPLLPELRLAGILRFASRRERLTERHRRG